MLQRHEEFIKERQYVTNVSPRDNRMVSPEPDMARNRITDRQRHQRDCRPNEERRSQGHIRQLPPAGNQVVCPLGWAKDGRPEAKRAATRLADVRPEGVHQPAGLEAEHEARVSSALIALLADVRIDEALSIKWGDVDFDNLLVLLHGKGGKDRQGADVTRLRKRLFVFQKKIDKKEGFVYATRGGTKLGRRNDAHAGLHAS